ncbi:hypothetical protein [uncultured Roseobacter sp.]|uniref:hypothetical protein n=1 Tax=uncultured Roseobacter sp. TaxID=114847 RepID=UPI0026103303|nr:hypothetical protein [uncultured Roseobacter sp.]
MDRLISMILRQITRRLVNKGINAGINKAASMRPRKDDGGNTPAHAQSKESAQRTKQAMKILRRTTRM